MSEKIYKLQPDRTVSLRGFNTFAATASIHSASPTGFTVSGTFRDPADFTVAVLYDADNFYEHPSIKYLPDFNFAGLTLNFTLQYSDVLQPIDSPKFNWIDWATLDCKLTDGSTANIRLWDHAMLADGASFPAATATITVQTSGIIQAFDRLTLWYQNLAYDYIVPAGTQTQSFAFFAKGPGQYHNIVVNGTTYPYTEPPPAPRTGAGVSSADIANALAAMINADTGASVTASTSSNTVLLTLNSGIIATPIAVSASDPVAGATSGILMFTPPETVAASLVTEINSTNWSQANATHAIMASQNGAQIKLTAARYGTVNTDGSAIVTVAGGTLFTGILPGSTMRIGGTACIVDSVQSPTQLTLTAAVAASAGAAYVAPRGGRDGNMIQLYATHKTSSLRFDNEQIQLAGGSSKDALWNCSIDFTALHIDQLRQCWLTFAPSLVLGEYVSGEWQAVFTNWQLTGDDATKTLKVAGPGSVRVEEYEKACVYAGTWTPDANLVSKYSKYYAMATSDMNATLTVTYHCQFEHDLYVGTSLYIDRGAIGYRIDNDAAPTSLNCYLDTGSALVTRRLLRAAMPPGRHTVTFQLLEAGAFYFDFLEAAVLSDIPLPLTPRTNISPALDFDTDHTYKLTPARLMWIMDQLGYAGPMNEYLGVFWWNERARSGGTFSTAQVQFSGAYAGQDVVFLTLNTVTMRKDVFPQDTPSTIAEHFAASINGSFVGAWAVAAGGTLTINGRSTTPAYNLDVTVSTTSTTGLWSMIPIVQASQIGENWNIDDTVSPPINRATRDWHADFYSLCAARGREVVTACSMELVNPPDGYAARYPDSARTPVSTATGFGILNSNHCAVGSSKMLAYQKSVYRNIAQMQSAAGLTPAVQYGEFLWWYFAGPGGMAYYDDETLAAAAAVLPHPLHVFTGPDDDPTINGSADALFLRNRLRDYAGALIADIRSAYPNVTCELLWPYDVNYPSLVPPHAPIDGGRLNRFINLPVEWQTKATSGFDRVKVEALAFGAVIRDMNLAKEAIELFPGFGWPLDSLSYLVPIFGVGTPWHRELALAKAARIPAVNLWAFDHVCLYNLDVPERGLERRSMVKVG